MYEMKPNHHIRTRFKKILRLCLLLQYYNLKIKVIMKNIYIIIKLIINNVTKYNF